MFFPPMAVKIGRLRCIALLCVTLLVNQSASVVLAAPEGKSEIRPLSEFEHLPQSGNLKLHTGRGTLVSTRLVSKVRQPSNKLWSGANEDGQTVLPLRTVPDYTPPPSDEPEAPAVKPPEREDEDVIFSVQGEKPSNEQSVGNVLSAADLPEEEVQKVLQRLDPLPVAPVVAAKLTSTPVPPPAPGKQILSPFPPPPSPLSPPAAQPAPPLRVVSFSPSGAINASTKQLSVTFSQPVVPLATVTDANVQAQDIVKLTPQPPGKWRWLDTRTLVFEPEDRFPRATKYTAVVGAGLQSAPGSKLSDAVQWSFSTELPALLDMSPPNQSTSTLQPNMVALFSQPINASQAISKIKVSVVAPGTKRSSESVRVLTAEEIEKDSYVKRVLKGASKTRGYLVFRCDQPFPRNAKISVSFAAGILAANGPLGSTEPRVIEFLTYAPLQLATDHEQFQPTDTISLTFNNPIDQKSFKPTMVKVLPPIGEAQIASSCNTITISGRKTIDTTYSVTFDPNLQDVYGQKLGSSKPFTAKIRSFRPAIYTSGYGYSTYMPYHLPPGETDLRVFTINYPHLKVKGYKLPPGDVAPVNIDEKQKPDMERTLKIEQEADHPAETKIDLSPLFRNGYGAAYVVVEPAPQKGDPHERERFSVRVRASRLAVRQMNDGVRTCVFVTSLDTGKPIPAAKVKVGKQQALTDKGGVASFPAQASTDIEVHYGDDVWAGNYYQNAFNDPEYRYYAFTDRGAYRPGEEVFVKGCVRTVAGAPLAGLEYPEQKEISVSAKSSRSGKEFHSGSISVDSYGAFSLSFKLPADADTGAFFIYVNDRLVASASAQEYRRPEFTVELNDKHPEQPHFLKSSVPVSLSANYYSGGALNGARVAWKVTAAKTSFAPAGWSGYSFETRKAVTPVSKPFSSTTDALGNADLSVRLDQLKTPHSVRFSVEADVEDINRQSFASTTSFWVHPSKRFVGLQAARAFVKCGEEITVHSVCTDVDGKVCPGEISLSTIKEEWNNQTRKMQEQEVQQKSIRVVSAATDVPLKFAEPGYYLIRATVTDEDGKVNMAELHLPVYSTDGAAFYSSSNDDSQLNLSLDKKEYRSGDTARIAVRSPYKRAEGMVTFWRRGILEWRRLNISNGIAIVEVPIKEDQVPSIDANVFLVEQQDKIATGGSWWAKHCYSTISIPVPPVTRTLKIIATPAHADVKPGESTSVKVAVANDKQMPVAGSQVSVAVVDESVLALTGFTMPDPIDTLYSSFSRAPRQEDSINTIGAAIDLKEMTKAAIETLTGDYFAADGKGEGDPGAGGGAYGKVAAGKPGGQRFNFAPNVWRGITLKKQKAGEFQKPGEISADDNFAARAERAETDKDETAKIEMRKNFNPLAAFVTNAVTGADGTVVVPYSVPDSLTRYRIMVLAVANEKQFGIGEGAITAKLPLSLRQSPPRFLGTGDSCQLAFVLQNQTEATQDVSVVVRGTPSGLLQGVGKRVKLAAMERGEVRFPIKVETPGDAIFQSVAAAGAFADSQQFSFPVYTPATTESFATYGSIDQPKAVVTQPLKPPMDVFTQFGGLEITTSSTALQELTDAVLYLHRYGFACSEQLSSRILALAKLRDVVAAFNLPSISIAEINASLEADLKDLVSRQSSSDGGFGMWKAGDYQYPYVNVYASHALATAAEKGLLKDKLVLERCNRCLRAVSNDKLVDYDEVNRATIQAYAVYVRSLLGDRRERDIQRILHSLPMETQSPETLGWLLQAINSSAVADGTSSPSLPLSSSSPSSSSSSSSSSPSSSSSSFSAGGSRERGSEGPEGATIDQGYVRAVQKNRKDLASEASRICRVLNNRITQTASTAECKWSAGPYGYLTFQSATRTSSIVLAALLGAEPSNEVIPKLVKGLLRGRSRGCWGNTQENAMACMALDRYFQTFEKSTPDFVSRFWLGDLYLGEEKFSGRSTETHTLSVPTASLYRHWEKEQPLLLSKSGGGRLYYRLGLKYAPRNFEQKPLNNGFEVHRTYEGVDDPGAARKDENGVWHFKAGSLIKVRLEMKNTSTRHHVALVDPLPAGLEPLNPELAGSRKEDSSPKERLCWYEMHWYDHNNLRDHQAEVFAANVMEGTHSYSYMARATTFGSFIVAPPKAEEMYEPETFGRGATEHVVVE